MPDDKEIIFMEIISDFLEKEYGIDRIEALAQSCLILDEIKRKEINLK